MTWEFLDMSSNDNDLFRLRHVLSVNRTLDINSFNSAIFRC